MIKVQLVLRHLSRIFAVSLLDAKQRPSNLDQMRERNFASGRSVVLAGSFGSI
jgi:hypothetical protein